MRTKHEPKLLRQVWSEDRARRVISGKERAKRYLNLLVLSTN
jgi:hypothetical protein